ncbi:hypothetical protein CTI12_AA023780 [Artemisia annua]|uniref:Uncharacterized protein n=1 Tax=Artemisia annua TaxID=35608 RepID=A0A2U1QJ37_ARTAN|nr:hypothetical protein CTI12_AA023780 [Artemisia annua]
MFSFLLTFLLLKSTLINSQSLTTRVLDSVLQEHAFAPFLRHRVVTGVVYDANVGPELTGIKVSALRLRSGALSRKGYVGFKEFDIPVGVVVTPYVGRVVLVYQNMGNWSSVYYGLKGYVFLSPVVGLLAYNATFLSPEKSPEKLLELEVRAVEEPMVVKFGGLKVLRNGHMKNKKDAYFNCTLS